MGLSTLLSDYTAQMAIIGVQLAFTQQVTAALDGSRSQKSIIAETAKYQLMQLAELSSWSASDIASAMTRCVLVLVCHCVSAHVFALTSPKFGLSPLLDLLAR